MKDLSHRFFSFHCQQIIMLYATCMSLASVIAASVSATDLGSILTECSIKHYLMCLFDFLSYL